MPENVDVKRPYESALPRKRENIDLSSYTFGKIPPQAKELEEAVLGAMMLEANAVATVIDILKPDSFYVNANKLVYQAIHTLFNKSKPIDILTVTEELKLQGKLEEAGGAYYVTELTSRIASAANVEHHARIVAQKFIQRELIRVSSDIIKSSYEDTTDVFELLDRAEQNLFTVADLNLRRNYEAMSTLLSKTLAEIEHIRNHQDELSGVPTGFSELDRLTGGWQKPDLIIVAARPGMGKCLGKGTKVVMFDGTLKNVEDVVPGDLLMGDDSTPRTVLGVNTGRENMYWVHQNHGISYRVNESHILSLKRSRNEGNHKHGDVLNITVREYLQQSDKFKSNYKGYKVAVEFEEKPLPVDPYFVGLWLGDGHSYSSRITNTDTEVIAFLGEYAKELELELVEYEQEGKTKNYGITKGQRGKQRFFSIQGELRELNLIENKHIPHQYIANSSSNRLQLLAGLIDSDGHYNSEFHVYEITQKNGRLAKDIKFLCDSLGFKTSLVKKKAQISERGFESEVYRIRLSGDVEKIPVRIERKKARDKKAIVDWRHTGITVEFDKVDDYYGFEIDGNRLFLLEDMTVTHNTAFVLSIARNAAVDYKKAVAIFSLEMSSVQLVNRLVSGEAEIEQDKMRRGTLADYEWAQLQHKADHLSEAPIFIDDTPAINIFELRAKCRRLKMQHDVKLIIIDYLQLMSGTPDGKAGNREQEISTISRSLKSIAKELDIPVIALSQLSRAVETRGGSKRPQLSDLRECVTGDTLVWLSNGKMQPIRELVGKNVELFTLNDNHQITTAKTELIWPIGKKPVYELSMASGRKMKATAEHLMLCFGGWKKIESIQEGERIALARTILSPEKPEEENKLRLALLAHMIGDGSYLSGQPLRYTTASEENSAIVKQAAEEEFNVKVSRHEGKGKWHQLVFSGNGNRWKPAGLNLWLREIGIFNQRSYEKQVPAYIFTLSNENIAYFLRHLWATDGTIYTRKQGAKGSGRISFSTNSSRLSQDVAALLLRLSIVSRIKVVRQKQYKPLFCVDISGYDSQLHFLNCVGAYGPKVIQAEKFKETLLASSANTNVDTIPRDVFLKVKESMREKKISHRKMASLRGTSYGGNAHFDFDPSREVLSEYAGILDDDQLRKIAKTDIFWDKVVSVIPAGEEEVFDLTVNTTHNWLANGGIITHNSGAIEQDADLVIFLYRAEYYGLEVDENNNPTRGVGELIVAKHRNGALKNVYVRFIDKFAKFVDADMGMGGGGGQRHLPPGPPPDGGIQTMPSKKWDDPDGDDVVPF